MNQGLRELHPDDLAAELERVLVPDLIEILRARKRGHCMRVLDLDRDLMVRLCRRLRAEVPDAEVVLVGDAPAGHDEVGLVVTSTKLVELRNPLPDGSLRSPLLVFIPSGFRAAAEDSFGVATVEDVNVGDVYGKLRSQLLDEIPNGRRGAVVECLTRLEDTASPWPFADKLAVARFLLTAKVNGADEEATGAALFEIGLVPDFELLAQPARAAQRIARNRDCVGRLTWSAKSERGRVLDLDLAQRAFRIELGNFLADAGLENPRSWTRRIVMDRSHWGLAFHKWEFEDGGEEPDSIFVGNVTTDLPTVGVDDTDECLEQLVGQQILPLGQGELRKFGVKFRAAPHPSKVQGLAKFVLQVISKDKGPIGLVRSKSAWKGSSDQTTVTFNKLNKVDWEEGWHFVRVLAQTEDGELIPLVDEQGNVLPWAAEDSEAAMTRPHESDLFYVLPDSDVEVDPPQRAVQREPSLVHAQLRLQFTALLDDRDPSRITPTFVGWAERKSRGRPLGGETIEAKFGREGTMNVPVSRTLKIIEQKILASPDGPVSWRIPISVGVAGSSTGEVAQWPRSSATAPFLSARAAYFNLVRLGNNEMVTQGVNFRDARPVVVEYARAYMTLVQEIMRRAEVSTGKEAQSALSDMRKVLGIDSVLLAITDHRGQRREAALVSPTHPLRALWLATWAALAEEWLAKAGGASKEFALATRDALLRQLAPIGFPPVLPTVAGRLFTSVDNLHPFWTLYAPSSEEDPRGLVGTICAALGLPEPGIGGAMINGAYLAARAQRYLLQHPYVQTLAINAFNPGRASVIAETLLELQKQPAFQDIRYDIRLFVPDPEAPGVGDGLRELLSSSGALSGKEADAFSTPTESHLNPKLSLAVRSTQEFRAKPDLHPAHLSFLFDVFPAEEVEATRASEQEACAPVHGLVQDFEARYEEDDAVAAWSRQPLHGRAQSFEGADELTELLASLPAVLSSGTAAAATGQTGLKLRPQVRLALDPEDRAMIHQVHEVSDWVVTIDRNMGIEFFDHGGLAGRPDYLIDHSPDMTSNLGHRVFITSRSVAELEAMLRPVMENYGLQAEGRHAVAILDQLRALSGRLALKLISSHTQRAEALGLALSRMFLEHQGVFSNEIVVPLDAHLELYRALKAHGDELGDEVSFKRTDLALFDLDAAARTVTCRLVEVKCYNQVGDLVAFNQLKDSISEQIAQSEQVLAYHFDPHRTPVDRPDRLLKSRELVTLLQFYLDRAVRYGQMSSSVEAEARFFLQTMEDGYRLAFTRSALIFDFDKPGTEPPDLEGGIEFHRIGVDLIQQLVDAASPAEHEAVSASSDGSEGATSAAALSLGKGTKRRASVPTLDEAAFLGKPRDRSVSWEDLRSKQTLGEEEISEPEAGDTPKELPDSTTGEARQPAREEPEPEAPVHSAVGGKVDAEETGPVKEVASSSEHKKPEAPAEASAEPKGPKYDVLVGATGVSPQYGLLGEVSARKVAIDLNQTHTVSLFGVQGGGKSYTLGTVAEMASLPIPEINLLPKPLATVIFHYSPTQDYKPEFTSMVAPNSEQEQIAALRDRYGAEPRALEDLILLVPADKLDERRAEYPGLEVHALKFAAAELQASHWRFLMGAVGNQATYMRQLNRIMKGLRNDLTLTSLRQGIENSALPDHLKDLARMRLDLAAEYIDDAACLAELIRPGRLLIVDLREEFIEKDEALGLFVVLLQLFADAKHEGQSFNKLVVFDEAHKYIESPDLVAGLIEVVREMRHKGTSIMVASQDPPSVPVALIELSSQIILHKFNSPAWLKHIQKANAALGGLNAEKMAELRAGEAYLWSSKATDEAFTQGAIKIRCRPRVTQHGGATKTAVGS